MARIWHGDSYAQYEAMPGTPDWTDDENPLSKSDIIAMYRYAKALERIYSGNY